MRFRGYNELTEDEVYEAMEYCKETGAPLPVVLHRMAGWGRLDFEY